MAATHVMYFDESGDHGLAKIDPAFPVFVLCGCLYRIEDYIRHDLPEMSAIKFETFGHDAVVFHSREIRKRLGAFQMLRDDRRRIKFMEDIAGFFRRSKATIIAAAIDKRKLATRYSIPEDPYDIALQFCLERLARCLQDRGAGDDVVACIFEQRGTTEDLKLGATFNRIVGGANVVGPMPFRIAFASKLANMPGLQVADLAAYPIARRVIEREAANPAYDAVATRLRKSPYGKIEGWGLKVFP